jgi:hypothetical protein
MLHHELIAGSMLGLLPAIIIFLHAIFLRVSRKRFRGTDDELGYQMEFLRPAWQRARTQDEIDFSAFGLLSRYPAFRTTGSSTGRTGVGSSPTRCARC